MKTRDSKRDLMDTTTIISHIHETHDMKHEQSDLEKPYNNELNAIQPYYMF